MQPYYNIQGQLVNLISENFNTLPSLDYPNIDNLLVTDDSCVWKIDRTSSQNSILNNQRIYKHCNEIAVKVEDVQKIYKKVKYKCEDTNLDGLSSRYAPGFAYIPDKSFTENFSKFKYFKINGGPSLEVIERYPLGHHNKDVIKYGPSQQNFKSFTEYIWTFHTPKPIPTPPVTVSKSEFEARFRKEAEDARAREEEKVRKVAQEIKESQARADEQARKEAEEAARVEAYEKTRREADERARREAEEVARREADEQARREADEQARKQAEDKAKWDTLKAEARARAEAPQKQKIKTRAHK